MASILLQSTRLCVGDSPLSAELENYRPPASREELLQRYASGERNFPAAESSEPDLSGIVLDGSCFDDGSWFFNANFDGSSLQATSFRDCNVKCASFRGANLKGTSFERVAVEATDFEEAVLEGTRFTGATFYGYTLQEGDQFPPNCYSNGLTSRCRGPLPQLMLVYVSVAAGPLQRPVRCRGCHVARFLWEGSPDPNGHALADRLPAGP